jgi:outer membrane protein
MVGSAANGYPAISTGRGVRSPQEGRKGGHMKGLRLLIAVVFGATLLGSASLLCPAAQATSAVGSVGAGGEPTGEYEVAKVKGTQVSLGLGAGAAPDYEGSKDYTAVPLLFARVAWESGMFLRFEGGTVRANLVPSHTWRLGPVVKYIRPRDHVEDKKVDDLKDVNPAVMVGGFAGYDIGRLSTYIQVVQDVSGSNDGLLATLGVGYSVKISEPVLMVLMASTSYASGDYMSTYFGIDAADSRRSGLKTYNTDAGFKDVGAGVIINYSVWEHVGFRAIANYTRLVGDAEDSPIVDDRGSANQFFGGLMVTYTF